MGACTITNNGKLPIVVYIENELTMHILLPSLKGQKNIQADS